MFLNKALPRTLWGPEEEKTKRGKRQAGHFAEKKKRKKNSRGARV